MLPVVFQDVVCSVLGCCLYCFRVSPELSQGVACIVPGCCLCCFRVLSVLLQYVSCIVLTCVCIVYVVFPVLFLVVACILSGCSCIVSGTQCETVVNLCTSQPCLNGGVCMSQPGTFTCQCPVTRAGMYCERSQLCLQGESSAVSCTVPCVSVVMVLVTVLVVVWCVSSDLVWHVL